MIVIAILIIVGLSAALDRALRPKPAKSLRERCGRRTGCSAHVLGTDAVGRDILRGLFYGARISLVIAVMVVIISGVVGIVLGAISGYFAGTTDFLIQKLVEVVWAFPPLLLAIAIMAFLGQGLENLILALVSQRWIAYCRVSRGQALSLRTREFVDAARSLGARHTASSCAISCRTCFLGGGDRHVLHGVRDHLGGGAELPRLGVPPEIPTWGSMLADGRTYISTSWWLALFPGLCIFFTVLGINLLGDGLRDILDPRLKRMT